MTKSVEERFWQKVDKSAGPDGCWLWLASHNLRGYGMFRYQGTATLAHRVAWVLTKGPIPKGQKVLHQCSNPPCVNPAHLSLSPIQRPLAKRFWEKVDKSAGPDGCWLWTAYCSPRGYGTFRRAGKNRLAHRVAWELIHGHILKGLLVCHHCDNPPCVNPAHLFLGTNTDNTQDSIRKGRKAIGEANSNRFTEEDILNIRRLYAQGGISQTALANTYNTSQQYISHIVNRHFWTHI